MPTQQITIDPYNAQTGAGTLSFYANKYGTDLNNLLKLNPQITDPNKISAGGILNVPGQTTATSTTALTPQIQAPTPANAGMNFTPFNVDLGNIDTSTFINAPKSSLDIAKILSENNAEIQKRREALASAQIKGQEELDLEKSIADLRGKVKEQNLQIEREGGGVNFVTGLQGNLAKTASIQEQTLLTKLGLVSEAREAKIKSAETGLAGAREDFDTQLKVYSTIKNEEDRIFDNLIKLNAVQKDKVATILDSLEGVDPDALNPEDQMTIANVANSIGITPSLLIDSLRVQYNKSQADLLYKKSQTEENLRSEDKPLSVLDVQRYNELYPDAGVTAGDTEVVANEKVQASNSPEAKTRNLIVSAKDNGNSYETVVSEIENDDTIEDKEKAIEIAKEVYGVQEEEKGPGLFEVGGLIDKLHNFIFN